MSILTHTLNRDIAVALATILLLCVPPAAGQILPGQNPISKKPNVSFVHGFMGDESSWTAAINQLENDFNFNTTDEGYDSSPHISTIASGYVDDLPNRSVVVAHSMGGLVTREIYRNHPNKVSGLITLGTPHRGAPMAANGDEILPLLANWAEEAANPLNVLFGYFIDIDFSAELEILKDYIGNAVGEIAFQEFIDGEASAEDMQPNSGFLQTLNAQEPDGSVASVPDATYVIYGTEDWHPALRTLDSFLSDTDLESGDAIEAAKALAAFYAAAALIATFTSAYYDLLAARLLAECDPFTDCEINFGLYGVLPIEDPVYRAFCYEQHAATLRHIASEMAEGFFNIRYKQGMEWERDIVGSHFPNSYTWERSDGIVPQYSAKGVPGVPPNRILPRVEGANHLELRVGQGGIDRIEQALSAPDIDIPRR